MSTNKEIKFEIEVKKYYPDASPQEIQALRNRVTRIGPDVILYHEVPLMTPFSVNQLCDKLTLLLEERPNQYILIDLRDSKRPDSRSRRVLNDRFTKLKDFISHVAFCTGKNILINTAAHFVMYQTNIKSFNISKTFEQAENRISEARQKRTRGLQRG